MPNKLDPPPYEKCPSIDLPTKKGAQSGTLDLLAAVTAQRLLLRAPAAKSLVKTLNAAGSIDHLLLAGIERMAL